MMWPVNHFLISLLCFCFHLHLVHAINYNALNKNQFAFTAIVPSDSSQTVAWGYEHYGGSTEGRTDVTLNGNTVVQVFSNERAFAVLLSDMRVVCYGSVPYGGDCHRTDSGHGVEGDLVNIVTISATRSALAAINTDGQIITWGVDADGGASTDYIAYWNENKGNFTDLTSSDTAFAARSSDIVLSWGEYPASDIAHATPSFASLDNVRFIQSNKEAFIAVNNDGTGYTWGNQTGGGNSASVTLELIDAVFTTDYAFAVLQTDGDVITWGHSDYGGDSTGLDLTNVVSITSTRKAFAALKSDGTVLTWGSEFYGGDHTSAANTHAATTTSVTLTSITEVYSNEMAFAAQVSDGTILTWGNSAAGGDSSALGSYSKCKEIIASSLAFVVLGTDGTATAWGDAAYGGDNSAVTSTNIEFIYANTYAFVALTYLNSVDSGYRSLITWGDQTYGGNFQEERKLNTDYVYGNEMFQKKRMTAPTPVPSSMPSSLPTVLPSSEPTGQPSGEPSKITVSPSGQPSGQPSAEPTGQPSALSAPVLSGVFSSNYTYYCRPYHVNTSAPNAYQRIEPQLQVSNSVGIVSATVTMSSYTSLDAMNLQESFTQTNNIVSKYANGVLTLTAKDGSITEPSHWTYVLSQAAYRFPEAYKPCSSFLDGYNPNWFTFQVTDRNGAVSNEFVKKMDLTTAAGVVSTQRSVVISRP